MRFVRFGQGKLPVWLFDKFAGRVLAICRAIEHLKATVENNILISQ